jgi:hypothetical protein
VGLEAGDALVAGVGVGEVAGLGLWPSVGVVVSAGLGLTVSVVGEGLASTAAGEVEGAGVGSVVACGSVTS